MPPVADPGPPIGRSPRQAIGGVASGCGCPARGSLHVGCGDVSGRGRSAGHKGGVGLRRSLAADAAIMAAGAWSAVHSGDQRAGHPRALPDCPGPTAPWCRARVARRDPVTSPGSDRGIESSCGWPGAWPIPRDERTGPWRILGAGSRSGNVSATTRRDQRKGTMAWPADAPICTGSTHGAVTGEPPRRCDEAASAKTAPGSWPMAASTN